MPRILVAETDPAVRSLLGFILETRGYEVDRVLDGAQAIDRLISSEPDLVITNIKMPEIDGFSLIKAIRRMPASKAKVPVIFLSGNASRENVMRSIQSGGNGFVSKSDMEVRGLLDKISALLGEEMTEAAAAAAEQVVAKAESVAPDESSNEKSGEAPAAEEQPEEDRPVYQLPDGDQIAETVSGLVGRDVSADKCDKLDLSAAGPYLYGVYMQTDGGKVAAISISELKLGAYAGAALSLIPVGAANEFIKKKKLDEEMFENYEEVINVSAALFNLPDIPHVKLRAAHEKLDEVPEDALPLIEDYKSRVDVSVDISDYGSGKMAIVAI